MTLTGRRVVLGVSGGIACYKSCTLARRLTEHGAAVDVVLTAAATEFVRPLTFEALTRRPVLTSLWERGRALSHIELAQDRDLIVVAPATARLLARAAQGIADDLLTAILLAARAPVLAAPGMNDEMYASPPTQRNVAMLRERGWRLLGPATGPLAEGPSERPGRMVEPEEILIHAERMLRAVGSSLAEKRVLVTAGPTRERLDPVRIVTNPSSGKMGYHLAARAFARGAEVVLVSGPTTLDPPVGPRMRRVTSTEELEAAVLDELPEADVVLMAAAPADYRPTTAAAEKQPRADGPHVVTLEPTGDVLQRTREARKPGAVVVGFALEWGGGEERARAKLEEKALDLVVLNRADEPGAGFEVDTNCVTLIDREGAEPVTLASKAEVAERILDAVEARL